METLISESQQVCSWHLKQLDAGNPGLDKVRLEYGTGGRVLQLSNVEIARFARFVRSSATNDSFNWRWAIAVTQPTCWNRIMDQWAKKVERKLRSRQVEGIPFTYRLGGWLRLDIPGRGTWKEGTIEWMEKLKRKEDIERAA